MKALIVVDMQNDFIDGALGTKEAQKIICNVRHKIMEYVHSGDRIVFTRDSHFEDYLNTNEGKHLPVKHCIMGTDGWNIPYEIDIESYPHINKITFGYTHWNEEDCLKDCDEIELVGLCTDICVVSNALILKAMFPETKISVDASCCAGVTPDSHNAALLTMKMCQVEVTNMED